MIANRAPSKKFARRLRSFCSHYKVYFLRPLAVSGEGQTTPKTRAERYAALLACSGTFRVRFALLDCSCRLGEEHEVVLPGIPAKRDDHHATVSAHGRGGAGAEGRSSGSRQGAGRRSGGLGRAPRERICIADPKGSEIMKDRDNGGVSAPARWDVPIAMVFADR